MKKILIAVTLALVALAFVDASRVQADERSVLDSLNQSVDRTLIERLVQLRPES
ncbi:MAG: hypothetical protein JXR96_29170 [Deltaproteobacteria bacterium]|nr:hypothetical protein [Deltaproteobacteria bacterium]